ncbi:MAG: c-type cytochrome [Devosia sp.]
MTPNWWAMLLAAEATALASAVYFLFVATAQQADPATAESRQLYGENCARCHGANLEGQPDWMRRLPNGRLPAPPHDGSGHTWHHSDKQLFTIAKFGLQAIAPGYESDMPAYESVLSDEEITLILGYIKSTWPERARAYQEERNRVDP